MGFGAFLIGHVGKRGGMGSEILGFAPLSGKGYKICHQVFKSDNLVIGMGFQVGGGEVCVSIIEASVAGLFLRHLVKWIWGMWADKG